MRSGRTVLLLALAATAGCRTGRNYVSPEGPRYAGGPRASRPDDHPDSTRLRVVSFNIAFARQVELDAHGSSDHLPIWAVATVDN